jgi:hypothetical protein
MWFSQEDTNNSLPAHAFDSATPRDSQIGIHSSDNTNVNVNAGSPVRKKRGRFFQTFNFASGSNSQPRLGEINDEPIMYGMSQDIVPNSQLSQDFSDRLGNLNVMSQQSNNSESVGFFPALPTSDNDSYGSFSGSGFNIQPIKISDNIINKSNEGYILPSLLIPSPREHQPLLEKGLLATVLGNNKPSISNETERKISVPPAVQNKFLPKHNQTQKKPSTILWLAPYKERPRYITDFEVVRSLGEGSFSNVVCVRRILTGDLYAVKKLKFKIQSESEGKKIISEVCAHAALIGCPNIVQYFSSWLDDGHLHIQTELCSFGTLEFFIFNKKTSKTKANNNKYINTSGSYSNFETIDSNPIVIEKSIKDEENILNNNKNESISENLLWLILEKLAETLTFMHLKGMAHLDLRPANIFISGPYDTEGNAWKYLTSSELTDMILNGECNIKLGDLGHVTRLDENKIFEEGEDRYCARELIDFSDSSSNLDLTKADIFSLGATIYELCLGRKLGCGEVNSDTELSEWHNIRDGKLDNDIKKYYSVQLIHVITLVRISIY